MLKGRDEISNEVRLRPSLAQCLPPPIEYAPLPFLPSPPLLSSPSYLPSPPLASEAPSKGNVAVHARLDERVRNVIVALDVYTPVPAVDHALAAPSTCPIKTTVPPRKSQRSSRPHCRTPSRAAPPPLPLPLCPALLFQQRLGMRRYEFPALVHDAVVLGYLVIRLGSAEPCGHACCGKPRRLARGRAGRRG